MHVLLCMGLLFVAFYDVWYRLIPNKILFILFFIRIFFFLVARDLTLLRLIEIIIIIFAGVLLYILLKNKIGAGDIKLLIVIGFYLPANEFLCSIFIFLILMLVLSIVLLFFKKVTIKTFVPLAPFIAIGVIINTCFLGVMSVFCR